MTIKFRKQTGDLEWDIRQSWRGYWKLYWLTGRRDGRTANRASVWMATFRELTHLDAYISTFEKPKGNLERLQDSAIARYKNGELTEEEFISEAMVYSLTRDQCDATIEEHREETGQHG